MIAYTAVGCREELGGGEGGWTVTLRCFVEQFKIRIMAKQSFTHYYVQAQKEGEQPEIVYHTYEEEEGEYYYKFLDKRKAKALAEAEKKITPDVKFRVVKCVETYEPDAWF
jgi:tRNA G37 N-methylase Trm5